MLSPLSLYLLVAGPVIADVKTDLARYAPGQPVQIQIQLRNPGGSRFAGGSLAIKCRHLDQLVKQLPSQAVTLDPGVTGGFTFAWQPPMGDFQGYSVEVLLTDRSGATLSQSGTAVDVSSTWTKFPRYGYLSSFPDQDSATTKAKIDALKDFHINALQFYDWQAKHHVPLAGTVANPAVEWRDIANRPTSRTTVLNAIDAAHAANMVAMNYDLLHGAWAGYDRDGSGVDPKWGLYLAKGQANPWSFSLPDSWSTQKVFLFNPANKAWQNYLFGRERDVFRAYPFDGWHVDETGGPPSTAYDASGNVVDVWPTFRGFLNNAKLALGKPIVFNNVGGYGMYDVCANSTEDVVYVECWPSAGQATYADLQKIIEDGVSWSKGKAVVVAAYMNYDYANTRSKNAGVFNDAGVLLTDATILASGGSHLELGDGNAMLCSEYFPNRNLAPSANLLAKLRRYYDFAVANENLLRDGSTGTTSPVVLDVPSSKTPTPDKVWTLAKSGPQGHVLNFVNLTGVPTTQWRDDAANCPAPKILSKISVRYYYGSGSVSSVAWGSPDSPTAILTPLPFTKGHDITGNYLTFTLPSLSYWDTVYLRR